jgi:DMSO/TMAO reductase YedYZ molybdopterin-dependent catalytic subunit
VAPSGSHAPADDGAARGPRLLAAAAGLAAGAVALGVAAAVAAIVAPAGAPLVALAAVVVDLSPEWLTAWAIGAFGAHDKAVLGVVVILVASALSALAGLVAARRRGWGVLLVAGLAGASVAAALSRPGASALAAVPGLAGAVAGAGTLLALVDRIPATAPPGPPAPGAPAPGLPRRAFVTRAALVAVGGAVAALVGQRLGEARRAVAAARAALRLPAPARPAPPLPAGVQVPGVGPFVTPAAEFYRVDTALTVPQVDPATWRLRVHGLVRRPVEITFAELLAEDLVAAWITLTCVSNPVGGDLAGNAEWLGLPVRRLLARAEPLPPADMVLSRSADGFTAGTPLEVLTDERDALLAVAMNGHPLPLAHGFPVRLVVPGLYGYVSATKWVVDLEVTRFADARAYWTARGWSDRAPVKTAARIEVPPDGARVGAGRVVVAGTSWAQHRGVVGVEVRVDDGAWQPARLAAVPGIDTWRQWSYDWDAGPGRHRLQVRAADPTGPQTGVVAGPAPDGATGWHTISVDVDG